MTPVRTLAALSGMTEASEVAAFVGLCLLGVFLIGAAWVIA